MRCTKRKRSSARVVKVVGARQAWCCADCRNPLEATLEIDHVVPLHLGGSNHMSNLQALCPACHARKTQAERGADDDKAACNVCRVVYSRFFRHECMSLKRWRAAHLPHPDTPSH